MSTETSKNAGVKVKKDRSPNYPIIGLQKAVVRSQELYAKYKRSSVPIHLAHEHWEYKPHSGVGNQCAAALAAYGLVDVEGVAEKRHVKLTDAAYQILMDAPARAALTKKAAVEPAIHNELWERYRAEDHFPDDKLIRNYLLFERDAGHFNENTVDGFIESFRSSLRYAGLLDGDIIGASTALSRPKTGGETDPKWSEPPPPRKGIKVGDFVQWTLNGVGQFPEPRPVLGLHGTDRAYFEVGGAGIALISELTVMDAYKEQKPPMHVAEQNVIVEERFTLDEGPVTIRWPNKLSAESVHDFEHHISGLIARARRKAGIKKTDTV